MRDDLYLPVSLLGYLHDIAEVPHPSVDLDLVVQELLEGGDIEDLVARWLGGIDDELWRGGISDEASVCKNDHTFLVIFGCFPLVGARVVFYPVRISLSLLFSSLVPKRGTGEQQSGVVLYILLQVPLFELVAKKCVSCAWCRCRFWPIKWWGDGDFQSLGQGLASGPHFHALRPSIGEITRESLQLTRPCLGVYNLPFVPSEIPFFFSSLVSCTPHLNVHLRLC